MLSPRSDQCVWGTLIDAYFKGFDVVYVEDCAGTTSPWAAEEMVRYNAGRCTAIHRLFD
jgi:nicotinamidase-related amidase